MFVHVLCIYVFDHCTIVHVIKQYAFTFLKTIPKPKFCIFGISSHKKRKETLTGRMGGVGQEEKRKAEEKGQPHRAAQCSVLSAHHL